MGEVEISLWNGISMTLAVKALLPSGRSRPVIEIRP